MTDQLLLASLQSELESEVYENIASNGKKGLGKVLRQLFSLQTP